MSTFLKIKVAQKYWICENMPEVCERGMIPVRNIQKIGVVCCSNGLPDSSANDLQKWKTVLEGDGITPVFSDCIFAVDGVRSGSAKERADCLMEFYRNAEIDAIFDISGGDIANEILPYLDYETIASAKNRYGDQKQFWGYSDLTVILNAIYTMTGNTGVLYQMRHFTGEREASLFDFEYSFIQGNSMSGIVAGGNIRCFLKLGGTRYFPDMNGKILLLEARSGLQPQMITFLSQLQQMGVFEKISGILLGTFTQLEKEGQRNAIGRLVKQFAGEKIPIAKTHEIGHAADSKAIVIGKTMELSIEDHGCQRPPSMPQIL